MREKKGRIRRELFRILLCFTAVCCLGTGLWESDAEEASDCPEGRMECRLLRMCTEGSFDNPDLSDALIGHIFSAVYPRLCVITVEDRLHFAKETGQKEEAVTEEWLHALANCLHGKLLWEPAADSVDRAVNKVLLLFLENRNGENPEAEEEKKKIREGMTDEISQLIAEKSGAPRELVDWLLNPER